MAFEMHKTIKQVKTSSPQDGGHIEMRIGIHTGEVIAGIIGTKQLRYDIWGTDCLVANTMESNGVPSGIVVSGSTARLIRNRYELIEGPIVEIKGRGAVQQFVIRCPIGKPEMTLATQFPVEESHAAAPPSVTAAAGGGGTGTGSATGSPAASAGGALDDETLSKLAAADSKETADAQQLLATAAALASSATATTGGMASFHSSLGSSNGLLSAAAVASGGGINSLKSVSVNARDWKSDH